MFTRTISFIIALFFVTLAAATHTVTVTSYPPAATPTLASQCNTGSLYCCNSVQQSSNSIIAALLAIVDVVVAPVTALVGGNCSPINVAGIGSGGACTAQPVCCQNNNFNGGLVVVGCTPITVGL